MPPPFTLSVGVDFGVCTSGISYCLSRPNHLISPPLPVLFGSETNSTQLEPTKLGYSNRQESWGSNIGPDEDKFTLFKLSLLHPDALRQGGQQYPERVGAVRDAISQLDMAGKRGVDVVAHYLGRMWAIGAARINRHLHDMGLGPTDVEMRFVFGIPAVWGEDAASRMREAINISRVLQRPGRLPASFSFIAEPEAAAIATLPQIVQSGGLKDGQTIVMCDCGGGTVDVISYEITSLSPLTVREVVCGEGQLLGDMFMRSALEALIKDSIPEYATSATLDQSALDNGIEVVWRAVSRGPSETMGVANRRHRLQLWHIDGSAGRCVTLSGLAIARRLRTVTDDIIALAQRQVDAVRMKKGSQPNLIVVVGGFGMNKFLQEELSRHFGRPLLAFTEAEGQLAVKHGAAMAGALRESAMVNTEANNVVPRPIHIQSRIARCSYGYHDPNGPSNQVTWFVSEGQHIPEDNHQTTFPLPSAAFTTTYQNLACATIYRAPQPMPPVSTVSGQERITQACEIWCAQPDLLGQVPSVEFSVQLRGAGMRLRVSGTGPARDVGFKVVYS